MQGVGKMMKKLTLIFVGIFLTGTSALALTGIANTPHNFTDTQPDNTLYMAYSANNEDELCVFCHTPHGGSLDGPLWNRDVSAIDGAGYYTHYSSDTLSTALSAQSGRAVNGPSLTCLSCHDGSIGIGDNLLNTGGVDPDNSAPTIISIYSGDLGIDIPGPKIGTSIAALAGVDSTTDLSDDHPISFGYSAVQTEKSSDFQSSAYVLSQGLTLYSGNVECSTCHDPHVDYFTDTTLDPFLRISNAGSAMCLSCHIK